MAASYVLDMGDARKNKWPLSSRPWNRLVEAEMSVKNQRAV